MQKTTLTPAIVAILVILVVSGSVYFMLASNNSSNQDADQQSPSPNYVDTGAKFISITNSNHNSLSFTI